MSANTISLFWDKIKFEMHPWLQDYLGSWWSTLALKAFLYYGTAISIFYFCRTLKKTG
jgi:hypothetical protein